MTYVWLKKHEPSRHVLRTSLAACPLSRFFERQGVQDAEALRWHALWHESAFEQERGEAVRALLQWMQTQARPAVLGPAGSEDQRGGTAA